MELSITPNPVTEGSHIHLAVPLGSEFVLSLYDGQGRFVKDLLSGISGGKRDVALEEILRKTTIGSGVYFVVLEANGAILTRKLLLLR